MSKVFKAGTQIPSAVVKPTKFLNICAQRPECIGAIHPGMINHNGFAAACIEPRNGAFQGHGLRQFGNVRERQFEALIGLRANTATGRSQRHIIKGYDRFQTAARIIDHQDAMRALRGPGVKKIVH